MLLVLSPWVHTTYSCNLACPYCHVRQKARHMSSKTFAVICDRLSWLMNSGYVGRVNLRISGGEPLLRFEHYVEKLRAFMSTHRNGVRVEFLTNLTIMPPGFMEFCLDKFGQLGLAVSLDSLVFSKPMKRRGQLVSSASLVRKNLQLFSREILRAHVGISTVATDSGAYLQDLAGYVARMGFSSWNVELDKLSAPEDVARLKWNISCMVRELVKGRYPLSRVGFENVTVGRTDRCGCGAGGRLITFDTNGDVYPCQTLLGQKKHRIATLDEYVPDQWGARKRRPRECEECPITRMCGGGCRYHNKGLRRKRVCEVLTHYVLEAGTACVKNLGR